jgi:ligand-binding sensor domain-containing protein
VLLAGCFFMPARGQPHKSFSLEMIDSKDGLSNNIVLDITQDSRGYMWFGTLNTLARYDGSRLTDFGGNNSIGGMRGTIMQEIVESRDSLLWVGSRVSGLNTYDPRSMSWHHHTDSLGFHSVMSITQDTNNRVLALTRSGFLIAVTCSSGFYSYDTILNGISNPGKILTGPRGQLILFAQRQLFNVNPQGELKKLASHEEEEVWDASVDADGNIAYRMADRIWYLGNGNPAVVHKLRGRSPALHVSSGRIFILDEGILYIYGKDALLRESLDLRSCPFSLLDATVNTMYESREGVIWIGTNEGIVKVSRRIYPFSVVGSGRTRKQNYVRGMRADNDSSLWVGYHRSITLQEVSLRKDEPVVINYNIRSRTGEPVTINCFFQLHNGDMLAGGNAGVFIIRRQLRTVVPYCPGKLAAVQEVWSMYQDRNGRLWIATNEKGLFIFDPVSGKLQRFRIPATRSYAIWQLQAGTSGNLWIGTTTGLWNCEKPEAPVPFITRAETNPGHILRNAHVWQIKESPNGLMIGTSNVGLLHFVHQAGKLVMQSVSFTEQQVSGLLDDSRGNTWISTMNGISCISPGGEIRHFTQDDGLPGDDFNFKACDVVAGKFCFGTKSGVVFFTPENVLRTPQSALANVQVAEVKLRQGNMPNLKPDVPLKLAHNENFFSISFFRPDYLNLHRNVYRYKLEGLDNAWSYASQQSPVAYYTNLSPGSYRFIVQSTLNGESWPVHNATLLIEVQPPFWKTLWFLALTGLLVSASIGVTAYFIIRQIIARRIITDSLSRQIAELELKALQSQMNPHFIFNAVNAIQHFIISNDDVAANNYLSKFATLMRLYLESSRKKFIPLDQEIQLLTHYIELEKLRFGDRMEYEITVAEGIKPEALDIPSMLLQPFVENAVIHGISPLKDKMGKLHVAFSQENDMLLIRIEDNGIGMKASRHMQESLLHTHRSRGLEIVQERIGMLKVVENRPIEVTTIDLAGEQRSGTRVMISIRI